MGIAASLAGPELISELVQDTAVKTTRQPIVLHNIADCFLSMPERIVPLLYLQLHDGLYGYVVPFCQKRTTAFQGYS
jgi:hypothetical protein